MQQRVKRARTPRNLCTVNLSLITSFKLPWLEESEETFESNCHRTTSNKRFTLSVLIGTFKQGSCEYSNSLYATAFGLTRRVILFCFYYENCVDLFF